jgi:hypothetical protein
MRRIISKKTEEKKAKRNQFILSIVLIIIMFSSILGYSLSGLNNSNSEKITYNNIEFVKSNNLWYANMGNIQFSFLYNPTETEKINSKLNSLNQYQNLPLYISSENSEAEGEIYRNLFYSNQIVQRIQYACTENEKCDDNFPVKNCSNNFIIIKKGEKNSVIQKENCVFIEGKEEDLIKLTDSFLFKITEIQ